MAAAAILDFRDFTFLTVETVVLKRVELYPRAKFRKNRSNCGRDMAVFRFFKVAVAASLDFLDFNFLTVGTVNRVELHQRTKFCKNRSNRG